MNRQQRRAQEKKKPAAGRFSPLSAAENLLTRGRLDEAAEIYARTLAQDPCHQTALYNLGMIRHRQERLAEAAEAFARLCALAPADAAARIALACVRMDQGKVSDALGIARNLAGQDLPPRLLVKLGILCREAGRAGEAKEFLERALEIQPGMIDAWYSLRTLKNYAGDEQGFRRLTDIAAQEKTLSDDEKAKFNFTLARALSDRGETDEAFARYAAANRLRKAAYRTPVSDFETYADNIIRLFTQERVRELEGRSRALSARPIFIVGMPRSGSTLVDQILSSHPDVASMGETKSFSASVPAFPNAEIPGCFREGTPSVTRALVESLGAETLTAIGEKYLALTEERSGGRPRLVDKMLFNFYWAGLIRLSLPEAKIIHCTRHPCDIGLSIWQLMFTEPLPWAYDLEDIGRFYLSCDKVMRHWKSLFPGTIHEVSYEALVADQETETRKLLEFCALPWNESCLSFHDSGRQVRTASALQVRAPIYKTSAGKWEKHRGHLSALIDALKKGGLDI